MKRYQFSFQVNNVNSEKKLRFFSTFMTVKTIRVALYFNYLTIIIKHTVVMIFSSKQNLQDKLGGVC